MESQNEIRKLLLDYKDIVDRLHILGFPTTNVVACYGEAIAVGNLRLIPQRPGNKGFDAKKNGKRYEIKARKASPWNTPTIFKIKKEKIEEFDYLILIRFDHNWNVESFLKIRRDKVKPTASNAINLNDKLRKQFNMPTMCSRMYR